MYKYFKHYGIIHRIQHQNYLYDFKSIIGNLNRQYSGNEQNDAQEFLLFLINTIHDELNLVANGRIDNKQSKLIQ